MTKQLTGKVAVITGGASGIGRALGEELALRGCEVVLADIQKDLLQEAEAAVRSRGAKVTAVELDVRDADAFKKMAKDTVSRSGRIDLFFNNAGIVVGGEMAQYTTSDFDDVLDVNLRGVAYGVMAVYPLMIQQGAGHIINTASIAGLLPTPGAISYTATKHAVVAMSRALRIEARRHGVRVSVVCPGAIRTPILTGGRLGRVNLLGATESMIAKQWEKVRPLAPDVFARRVVDRVIADDPIIVVPAWWKLLWYLDRLSPYIGHAMGVKTHKDVLADFEAAGATPGRPDKTTNGHDAVGAA
jgi:NAD(P)-dependent dehydrogenase (short-subunit alcohol dehydrogenase family)